MDGKTETEMKELAAIKPELRETVLEIARMAADAGGRAFMVGGSVRDMLLGSDSVKDVDLEIFGIEPAKLLSMISAKFPVDECGASFGVLKIKHKEIDVALPRRESKYGTGHKGFLVDSDPWMTVEEAASRRDFTVNAVYFDPVRGVLEDPYGGAKDLRARVLRHVSPKFSEDPLRVLRGMQFVARFGLTPAPETIEICRTITTENLPPERMWEEWSKLLLKGKRISAGMDFLRRTGWVDYFPELRALIGCEQDPMWHSEGDVWNHTCGCLDSFAKDRTGDAAEDLVVGLAVLCHDLGKPATTKFEDGRIRSRGHDEAGEEPTMAFLARLTNEERILKEVPPLVKCHMQPFALYSANAGSSAIRRLALRVGRIDRLVRVSRADIEGSVLGGPGEEENPFACLEWLTAKAEKLRIAASAPKPILMGRHLMELEYKPSPIFGKWIAEVFEAQLDGTFANLEGAIKYFKEHVADRGTETE